MMKDLAAKAALRDRVLGRWENEGGAIPPADQRLAIATPRSRSPQVPDRDLTDPAKAG
jgi:hypothetical protein